MKRFMKYKVNEIFNSIQGEGLNLGKKVTFVRMAGCNLKCKFCDTNHKKTQSLNREQILQQIGRAHV